MLKWEQSTLLRVSSISLSNPCTTGASVTVLNSTLLTRLPLSHQKIGFISGEDSQKQLYKNLLSTPIITPTPLCSYLLTPNLNTFLNTLVALQQGTKKLPDIYKTNTLLVSRTKHIQWDPQNIVQAPPLRLKIQSLPTFDSSY